MAKPNSTTEGLKQPNNNEIPSGKLTVCELEMAIEIVDLPKMVIFHRYMTVSQRVCFYL